ncbi:ABC transporter permease [Streptodolium elevatio]
MTMTLVRRPGLARVRTKHALLYVISAGFVGLVVLVALLAPWIAPHDPNAVELGDALAPPSGDHLLGVDSAGRDTLSRIVEGARTSLLGPLGVVVFSTVLGAAVGVAAGRRGGWLDSVLSRGSELALAFPRCCSPMSRRPRLTSPPRPKWSRCSPICGNASVRGCCS